MYLNHAYFKTRSDSVHAQLFKLHFIFFNLHFIFFKLHVSYFNILFIFFKSTFIFFKLVFIFFKSRLKRCSNLFRYGWIILVDYRYSEQLVCGPLLRFATCSFLDQKILSKILVNERSNALALNVL